MSQFISAKIYNYHIPDVKMGDVFVLTADAQVCEYNLTINKIEGKVRRASAIVGHDNPTPAIVLERSEYSLLYYKVLWLEKVWVVLVSKHTQLFRDGKQILFYPEEGW
jgi:hypothetical protein